MFIIFKNFVIHLFILSFTCSPLASGGIVPEPEPTDDFEKKVQREMAVFDDFVNEIKDMEKRGELKGNLRQVIRRAVMADELLKKEGGLETLKNDADKYRLLLGLTYRIDCVESTLAPGVDLKGKQRRVRWSTIFSLKTPAVEKFKKKVADAGMTEVAFAECIERLCNERDNRAGRAKISLPKIVDEKTIESALSIMEIIDDRPVVETIKIIVAPVEGLDSSPPTQIS